MAFLEILAKGALHLGFPLSPQQLRLFEIYYRILLDWNRRLNLTAITDFQEVQLKHFVDSLTVATAFPEMSPGIRFLDVGTGAGLPGIPLKILFPELRLVLLDSVAKKARFLHYVVSQMGLQGVEIVTGRAEELGHDGAYREQFPVVVARAIATLPALLELTLPFCSLGGIFIAPKKGEIAEELEMASPAMQTLGGRLLSVNKLAVPDLDERFLIVVSKVASTPSQYPRRPGVPSRRPIMKQANRVSIS